MSGKETGTVRFQFSAGGVIFRNTPRGSEVALINPKGSSAWTLPKGLIDKGESPEETSAREVEEETGLKGRRIGKIGEITYWYRMKEENVRCKKTVYYYLMEFEGGSTENHDWEVEESAWVPIEEAVKKATYPGDREILTKAMGMIAEAKSG